MDLGHHRLQHRRTGWHLDHRDRRPACCATRRSSSRACDGDLVAGALAVMLIGELHLQFTCQGSERK